MNYTPEKLQEVIIDTIVKGKHHEYYDKTVEDANYWSKIITGYGQEELLIKARPNETKEQKEQRVRLTDTLTPAIYSQIKNQFKEVKKADDVVRSILKDGKAEDVDEITDALNKFYANDSLDYYLHDIVLDYNMLDPNAFLLIEQEQVDEKIVSYPVILPSYEVINYEYKFGQLVWLIAMRTFRKESNKIDIIGRKERHVFELKDWYLYSEKTQIHIRELSPEAAEDEMLEDYDVIEIQIEGAKARPYLIKVIPDTGTSSIPLHRIGYIKDISTNRKTCCSILESVRPLFNSIIKRASEFDLALAMHGFIQKYVLAPDCQYVDATTGISCDGTGYIENTTCPKCHGSGMDFHTTQQDIVVLNLNTLDELNLKLPDLVHYAKIDSETITITRNEIDAKKVEISVALFGHDIFDKSQISETATAKLLEKGVKNNAFSEYGKKYSALFKSTVLLISDYLGQENITVLHGFPSDFKLESVSELLDQRAKAIGSNAPFDIVKKIDYNIIAKQYKDSPETLLKLKALDIIKPYANRTESERVIALQELDDNHPKRLLWLHFEEIASKIDSTVPLFYKLDPTDLFDLAYSYAKEFEEEEENPQPPIETIPNDNE